MEQYLGQVVNPGVGIAKVFVIYQEKYEITKEVISDIANEETRLEEALSNVISSLNSSKKIIKQNHGSEGSDIIKTHIMLLTDSSEESLIFKTKNIINQDKVNAEYALIKAFDLMKESIKSESASSYLSARSEDIDHLKNMLLGSLLGHESKLELKESAIIVANELSPEQLASLDPKLIKGIITAKGSPLSHTAILARNKNIPFLTGVTISANEIKNDTCGIIDTEEKLFILNPDDATKEKYIAKEEAWNKELPEQLENAKKLVEESPIKLYANIGKPEDVDDAISNCAAGIGLFRSEFLYMDTPTAPDEQSQYEVYVKVLDAMDDKPVTIRTIDIGADKEVKCLSLSKEPNPALGTRGIRISFSNPKLFNTQLRALLRAGYKRNLKIMFPMISSLWEVQKAIDTVNKVAKDLESEGIEYEIPSLGIMVETPAAVMILEDIAPLIDFISIGTNDLTQYTIALDRVNDSLAEYYDAHHKAVLKLIKMAADVAHKYNIEVGICGELGADLELAKTFLDMGIDELSMASTKILAMATQLSKIKPISNDVLVPVDGYLIPMADIPDAVFSNGLVGNCVGIYPENGTVVSPFDGIVTMIAKTKHAISIKSDSGKAIMIHVGLDTVEMNGRGFDVKVSEGDAVLAGDELLTFDIDEIKNSGYEPIVIVVNLPQ